jgi:hypothetical protein
MDSPFSEQGRALVEARYQKRDAARAALADAMPPLDSIDNAKRRLAIINDLAVNGLLAGSQAGAAVRAVEAWIKAEAMALDLHRIKEMERTISELEAELRKVRAHGRA